MVLSGIAKSKNTFNYSEITYLSSNLSKNFDESFRLVFPALQVRILHRPPLPVLDLDERPGGITVDLLFKYN